MGLFKVDADGNISAVETIVHYDDDGNSSTETVKLRIHPSSMFSVTDDLMVITGCSYYDDNGYVPLYEYEGTILVNKSTGIIYSLANVVDYYSRTLEDNSNYYAQESSSSFIAFIYPNLLYRISISGGEAVAKQLVSEDAPIFEDIKNQAFYSSDDYTMGKIFSLSGDKAGIWGHYQANVIYSNGGYEHFVGQNVIFENGLLSFDNGNCELIHLGEKYGESTRETLASPVELGGIYLWSWYENDEKLLFYQDNQLVSFNKTDKSFTFVPVSFSGSIDLQLWKENICGNRFYGLVSNEAGEISAAYWLNPTTYEYGEVPLNLNMSEIDILSTVKDYRHASVQIIGMRRSDGYKVAINIDLRDGSSSTIFSDPNLTIQTLLRLN